MDETTKQPEHANLNTNNEEEKLELEGAVEIKKATNRTDHLMKMTNRSITIIILMMAFQIVKPNQ